MGARGATRTPRDVFAERFALLYAEAGDPPLKLVAASVARGRRAGAATAGVRVSAQRISDWRRGRNVPAKFEALAAVLEVLVPAAKKARPRPIAVGLYDVDQWRALWRQALASPVTQDDANLAVGDANGTNRGDTDAGVPAVASEGAPVPGPRPGEPEESPAVCPYQGLAAFGEQHAGWFFGRTRSTAALLARLEQALSRGGLVALVGASGAGKSSLLHAGLRPAVADGRLGAPGSERWPVVTMTPGADPQRELAERVPGLPPAGALGAGAIRAAFAAHAAATGGPDARLVLVVDQFEELFTLCPDEDAARAFVRTLHTACTPAPGGDQAPALVVIGMRADFYGRCLDYPELAHALQERQLVLGPMSPAELREAVGGPAKAVGLQLEPGLVELMLRDLGAGRDGAADGRRPQTYDAGALPLLSHALLATWQRRRSGRLTLSGYRACGGIHGAVAATGERAWAELDAAGQAAARGLLLRLVRIGADTRDTRRRSTRTELLEQAANPAATQDALERLAKARLITLDADSVEISHEALLYAWPRLRRWIDADRDANLARQRLHEDAQAWEAANRESSLLYHGARVEAARQVAKPPAELSPLAREFLRASVRARLRAVRARRAALAAVCVFALIATLAAGVAIRERDDAQFRQLVAEADRAQQTDPTLAAQLDLLAHRLRPDDASVRSRLLATENTPLASQARGHTGAVYLTTFSPDRRTLATASFDKTIRLWDVSDPTHPTQIGAPLAGGASWLTAAVFSPDGRTLASTGNDGTLRMWDVADPAHPRRLALRDGGHGAMYLLAFSPDGRTLASADDDGTAQLWNVANPSGPTPLGPALTGPATKVRSVAISPDGRTLAAGSDDHKVWLWDIADPGRPGPLGPPLSGFGAGIHSVAFSPRGHVLAAGSEDDTIRLWDVSDPTRPAALGPPLVGHSSDVWSVAFTPDGRTLASGAADGTVRLWNLANPSHAVPHGQPLAGRSGIVYAVGFSPDGRTLAAGSDDGVVRLWSIPAGVLGGHTSGVAATAFRPDGKLLATTGSDATIRLWDLSDPARPAPVGSPLVNQPGAAVYTLRFTPDGRYLASGSSDRAVRLWDLRDPARPVLAATLTGDAGRPIAISGDGRLLATGSDYDVQLWRLDDVGHPTHAGRFVSGHAGYITALAFTPDRRTLISASFDRTIRLWDVADPDHPRPLAGPLTGASGPIWSMALRPDGRVLAAGSGDNTIQLWDVADPRQPRPLGAPLTGHSDAVTGVAFSPDGGTLASVSHDKTIRLWDVSTPAQAHGVGDALAGDTGALSALSYRPDGDMLATGSDDDTAQLWDLNVDHAIARVCSITRDLKPSGENLPGNVSSLAAKPC